MTKYDYEIVPLSNDEVKEAKSEKCKCGKASSGLARTPEGEHVICTNCVPLLDGVYEYVDWQYISFSRTVRKMRLFDPNCHL